MKPYLKDRDVCAPSSRCAWMSGAVLLTAFLFIAPAGFAIDGGNAIILVNENSTVSRYIAQLYREYRPELPADQVLYLSGLTDCCGETSTAEDEIITRQQYEQYIAGPVRSYLLDPADPNRLNRIMVIITTAGMPYRIEDSNPAFHDVIKPGGSNPDRVIYNEVYVDAASVESELACLWFIDYGTSPLSSQNRMVNPFQGYRASPIENFSRRETWSQPFTWTAAKSNIPSISRPRIEGRRYAEGAINRNLNPGDIYLTARLDGPKPQGQTAPLDAIHSVRKILHRAWRAENIGIDPAKAVALFDDAPLAFVGNVNENRTFNLPSGLDYQVWTPADSGPADVTDIRFVDDYCSGFYQCCQVVSDPCFICAAAMQTAWDVMIAIDRRENHVSSITELEDIASDFEGRASCQGVLFFAGYGTNGDEGHGQGYINAAAQNGGALGALMDGAVFTSVESLNAVTMFTDVVTEPVAQGKIVDFISAGGTAAIGHSFEPQVDAAIDTEFLIYNLLSDENADGYADLTFAEAAFSALPYLSWCEVVIGDPLLRIKYNMDGTCPARAWYWLESDANNDDKVTFSDLWEVQLHIGGRLDNPDKMHLYNDLCDADRDGKVTFSDLWAVNSDIGNKK